MKSKLVPILIIVVVVGSGGWFLWQEFAPVTHPEVPAEVAPVAQEQRALVVLTPEKLAAAALEVTPVQLQPIQDLRTVPGRIQYDDTRHIEVKIPVGGILSEVRVKPGDVVAAGDVLALLSSPEVGNARSDVLKQRAELALAQRQLKWQDAVCSGLKILVNAVEEGRDAEAIIADMNTTSLGSYREQVMSAYTRYRLASNLVTNVNTLSESGAVSESTVQQRRSELSSAEAALKGVTEQSLIESQRQAAEAQAAAEDAARHVRISEQHLETLLGYREDVQLNDEMQQLSHVEIRAPFNGTIEAQHYSSSERVTPGDSLCVLANTSQLWVAADIRDREWGALQLQPGQLVEVNTPGLPDRSLSAKVYFVGRQVDPLTNAVPLIATIDNTERLLRPGQFVRVALPVSEAHEVAAVPSSALLKHGELTFVFVQLRPAEFEQRTITPGLHSAGWTAVTGIPVGTPVVSTGAFQLKSELLLESE